MLEGSCMNLDIASVLRVFLYATIGSQIIWGYDLFKNLILQNGVSWIQWVMYKFECKVVKYTQIF